MSNKYLYGFTNEPSYDFTKVIYFGKQSRADRELKRVAEHYKKGDPNHEELAKAKYILVSVVEVGLGLSDLEAYFIQTYKPYLNTVYNPDYSSTLRLTDDDLSTMKPLADTLTWYLIPNSEEEAKRIDLTIYFIQKMNEYLGEASYCFKSREELNHMTFDAIKDVFSEHTDRIYILPEVSNSLLFPLTKVNLYEGHLSLCKFNMHSGDGFSHQSESIQYVVYSDPYFIPEVNLTIGSEITSTRDRADEDFKETTNMEEIDNIVISYFKMVLAILATDLQKAEPTYIKGLTLIDFQKEMEFVMTYNEGFNSRNYPKCLGLFSLLHFTGSADGYRTIHIDKYLAENDEFNKIINMPLTDYIEWYNSLSEADIDKLNAVTDGLNPENTASLLASF